MSPVFWAAQLRPPGCLLEVEQAEKGKHSWELGKGDLHVALKESQRVGSFVAAGQWGACQSCAPSEDLLTQPNG